MKMKQTQLPKEETSVSDQFREQENKPLGEKLATQIQRTPWWMISMTAHIVLLILLALIVYENPIEIESNEIHYFQAEKIVSNGPERPPRDTEIAQDFQKEMLVSLEQPQQPEIIQDTNVDSFEINPAPGDDNKGPAINTGLEITGGDPVINGTLKDAFTKSPGIGDSTKTHIKPIFDRPLHPPKHSRPPGTTRETNEAVKFGLAWLAAHQNSDGSWDPNPGTAGRHKVAITSMALLAFFGEGYNERRPKYAATIRKGVNWLLNDVDESTGKFKSAGVLYEQGLGTMALNEAYGMLIKRAKSKAIAATRFIIAAQTDKGGWNYNPGGQNGDTSVTGFQVQALKLAKEVFLGIDTEVNLSLKKAREWVEYANDKQGNTGYSSPAKGSIALTAAGAWMRMYTDSTKSGDEQMRLAVQNIGQQLPAWDGAPANQVNMYYCYYGTLVSFQWDGAPWKQWDNAMKTYVTGSQIKTEGDTKGSWSPAGQWSENWGRSGQTALSVLCLEVYYRYPRFLK